MKINQLREQRGATTVEFAIIAIVLFLVVFSIIEFGVLMYDRHVLTNASREGARAGVVMRNPRLLDSEIKAVIEKYAKDHMVTFGALKDLDFEDPWITPAEGDRAGHTFGKQLKVTVKYDYNFLFLSYIWPGSITLKAETRMRME